MKLPIFSPLIQSSSNFIRTYLNVRAFLVAQTVKNPLAMWETWVRSLGWEDPLEESMATHSNILLENPHGQRRQSMWSQRIGYD